MKYVHLFLCLFVIGLCYGQNQVPQIIDLKVEDSGSKSLIIQYDLVDQENDDCVVYLLVSKDGGISYNINTSNATGDVHLSITPSTNKRIVWDYSNEISSTGDYHIKLVVDDGHEVDIQALVDQVDINSFSEDLGFITGIRHRRTGVKHLEEVRDLIKNRFLRDLGNLTTQEFDFNAETGQNYISSLDGFTENDEIYIIDAHYDGVTNSPGADDNGTGTAGLLEAARVLSQYPFKKEIKFIGFDLEESGLIGSRAYAQNSVANNENIKGVINFEAIGYYSDKPNSQDFPTGFDLLYPEIYTQVKNDSFKGNFIANVGVVDQDEWEKAYESAAKKYVPQLKVVNIVAPDNWQSFTPDLARSDHAPFWIINKPAIMLTGTANFRNPNYHTPNDTLGSIDFGFAINVVKAAVATIAEHAEIIHGSTATSSININIDAVSDVDHCQFAIYPNPVVDELKILNINCINGAQKITIYDITGGVKHLEELSKNIPLQAIDVNNWKTGLYLLKIGESYQKFIKQ